MDQEKEVKEMTSEQKALIAEWKNETEKCKRYLERAEWQTYDYEDQFHYMFRPEIKRCIEVLKGFDEKGWLDEEMQKDLRLLKDGYGLWTTLSEISEDAGVEKWNMQTQREFLLPILEGVDDFTLSSFMEEYFK